MKRIAIVGNAGGGKTTISRELSRQLGIPWYQFDDIQWLPGWVHAPQEEIAHMHHEWLSCESWIIDGWGSWPMMEERFRLADALVLVDLPFRIHVWRSWRRTIESLLGRESAANGCQFWRVALPMTRVMWRIQSKDKHRLRRLMMDVSSETRCRFFHLTSRDGVAGFAENHED